MAAPTNIGINKRRGLLGPLGTILGQIFGSPSPSASPQAVSPTQPTTAAPAPSPTTAAPAAPTTNAQTPAPSTPSTPNPTTPTNPSASSASSPGNSVIVTPAGSTPSVAQTPTVPKASTTTLTTVETSVSENVVVKTSADGSTFTVTESSTGLFTKTSVATLLSGTPVVSGLVLPNPSSDASSSHGATLSSPSSASLNTSAAKKSNTGAVTAAAVCGVILFIVFIFVGLFYLKRYRRKQQTAAWSKAFQGDMMVKPDSNPIVTTGAREYMDANAPGANFWEEDDDENHHSTVSAKSISSRSHESRSHESRSHENEGAGRLIPGTDRQMQLAQNIHGLKMKMVSLDNELAKGMMDSEAYDAEIQSFRARINRLEALENSDWALERTDEVPKELFW